MNEFAAEHCRCKFLSPLRSKTSKKALSRWIRLPFDDSSKALTTCERCLQSRLFKLSSDCSCPHTMRTRVQFKLLSNDRAQRCSFLSEDAHRKAHNSWHFFVRNFIAFFFLLYVSSHWRGAPLLSFYFFNFFFRDGKPLKWIDNSRKIYFRIVASFIIFVL